MSAPNVFRLFIDLDTRPFQPSAAPEIARILRTIADRLDAVVPSTSTDPQTAFDYADRGWIGHYQTINDVDGADVGRYAIKPKDD